MDRFGLFRIGKYPVFRWNVLRQVYQILHAPCVVSQDKSCFKGFQSALIPYFQQGVVDGFYDGCG